MINESPQVSYPSVVLEGVSFTITKMSFGKRSRIRKKLASTLAAIREKTEEIERVVDSHQLDKVGPQAVADDPPQILQEVPDDAPVVIGEIKEPITSVATKEEKPANSSKYATLTREQISAIDKISDIQNEIDIITATESDPVYLQECFVSVDGYQIAGKVPDWKLLLEAGNEELCKEIIQAIKAEAGLTVRMKENLKSPITSGAAVDGQMNDTTAPAAS